MSEVYDVSGRGPTTAALARRGVLTAVGLALAVALLVAQYQGAFRTSFPATVVLADLADGMTGGADVKLRGAMVGTVEDVQVRVDDAGRPLHEVAVALRPEQAARMPAGMTARVVPTNVFGAPSVELLDPADPVGRPRLEPGAMIAADRSDETLRLQTVLTRLTAVLRAVQPAKLNVALSNIAQGLSDRGARVGDEVGRLDRYLTVLNGRSDDLSADIRLLGTDLQALADAAPALLDAVDNAVVTSRTLVDERDRLAATLTGGAALADGVHGFLEDADDRLVTLVDAGSEVAGTLAPQRDLIPSSLSSLGRGTRMLGEVLGPGGSLILKGTPVPYRTYTAADCPRYPGLSGPNCGRPAPSTGLPGAGVPGAGAARRAERGAVGGPAEAGAVASMLGGQKVGAAGVLLLGPIVRGSTVVRPS